MRVSTFMSVVLIVAVVATPCVSVAKGKKLEVQPVALTEAGQALEVKYTAQMKALKAELKGALPAANPAKAKLDRILASDALDAKLVKYVVLHEATPRGLAEFAQKSKENAMLIERMLGHTDLMRRMLVADGAKCPRTGQGYGPAQYGPAIKIYSDIRKASSKSGTGVLKRLALAIGLEHAVPISQRNPTNAKNAPATVDPVKRYLHYERAYLAGELDAAFRSLSTWNLRFVVDGNEPDETLVWGREMLRNFHPDHIYNSDYGWRYVNIVGTDVRYGSGDVKYDRPELQFFQNILMNGGVCGRRAFFGRFILRSFGIPTTARPSRGHAALAHWTPKGWVVNLGPRWGGGWTKGLYKKDLDFLASSQARAIPEKYLQVKRAQWIGDVMGETRVYGESGGKPAFWNGVSLSKQRAIIKESKAVTLAALGTEIGESNKLTEAQKVIASPVTPADKKIAYRNGIITIPAAAYCKPRGNTREVYAMKSFSGGLQIFMPRFTAEGVTILRGGAWRGGADGCRSGSRLKSSGYGRYNNWGFRAAMSHNGGNAPREVKLDLGDGIMMEFIYIKPGSFVMGGENTKDSKWNGIELPKHEVTITKGFYMGKYEVTQEQFQHVMGSNPSGKMNRGPKNPADTISEADAVKFCELVAGMTERPVRLPFEAEWEYACRAGSTTKWFFGDNASKLGDYAWYKSNDGGKSHPVGQKKPNPWGLYDICGNVCERVADRYNKTYYKQSPKKDPTGPGLKKKSFTEYKVNAPQAGKYTLTAKVVTANYNQHLLVSPNGDGVTTMLMPFTCGTWKECKPVTITLKKGENTLQFWRLQPPQYGMALKSFTLQPAR